MQLNVIDYKELTQTAWGRSQHNNDKLRVFFCRRDQMRKRLQLNMILHHLITHYSYA